MNSLLFRSALAGLALVALSSSAGCAVSGGDAETSSSAVVGPDDSKEPTDPAPGPRIESVRANGTGCRGDESYAAEISPDGSSVLVHLRSHEVSVARGEAFAIADCTISVRVADADGRSFTLASFENAGYASLHGADMKSTETVNAYMQGDAVSASSRAKELVGAVGGHRYTFGDTFEDDAVWSPCGGGRDLNVLDRIVLRNNPDKTGFGYVGSWTVKLALAWRDCNSQ